MDKIISEKELQRREKIRQAVIKHWSDPVYRRTVTEKQKLLGYRTYPQTWQSN